MECYNNEESLRGQAEVMKYAYGYFESMVVNCAVELRIPDIIHSHGGPITLAQIVAQISDAPSPDTAWLARIMHLLVRRGIFASHGGAGQDELFGLTRSSRWLLRDPPPGVPTLAPYVLTVCHKYFVSPTHFLGACVVKSGGNPIVRAYGKDLWESLAEDSEWNALFNEGMACSSEICLKAVVAEHGQEVFGGLRSIVDVGGGTGAAVNEIVKSYPNIRGINFDIPHVIATAPAYSGVSHVAGDAFESVPNADAIIMKWFLQNWSDEECVKILKNCHKALPKERGKVIIVDVVFEPRGESLFDDAGVMIDLVLGVITTGRARSESEWNKILEEAGFKNCKVTKTTTFTSIVEAYPH